MSAEEALVEPYFFTEPLPAHHSDLPIPVRGEHEVSVPRSWLRSLAHTHTHTRHALQGARLLLDVEGPIGLVDPESLPV